MTELDAVQQAERRAMAGDRQAVLLIVSELRRCREQAKADAQALADMRTLDAWAAQRGNFSWKLARDRELYFIQIRAGYPAILDLPACPTPDAARCAAAAWVREQGK